MNPGVLAYLLLLVTRFLTDGVFRLSSRKQVWLGRVVGLALGLGVGVALARFRR